MDLEKIGDKTEDWAREHPERVFIAKSLCMLCVMIMIKYLLREVYILALILIPLFFIGWIVLNAFATNTSIWSAFKEYITIFEVPRNSGKERIDKTAYATIGLIGANVFVFLFIQSSMDYATMLDYFAFPPRKAELWNYPISVFSSMFLHGDEEHIFYNMFFLWVTGSIVEKRIGHKRFFWSYILCGVAANLFAGCMENMYSEKLIPGIGASGAISGVMGLYMVRCYYRDMYFPIASAGILNFNVKINSFIVIGIYFAKDMRGGLKNIVTGEFYGTGYFCHLGGILTGIAIAYYLKLQKEAMEERHRSLLTDMTDENQFNYKIFEDVGGIDGARTHADLAIKQDENNPETHLAMARIKSKTDTFIVGSQNRKVGEGMDWYIKALDLMVRQNHKDTVTVFLEYFKQYGEILQGDDQLKISLELYRRGNYSICLNSLEMLQVQKGLSSESSEKALYFSALCSEKLGLWEHSCLLFRDFIYRFPDSRYRENAEDKIRHIMGKITIISPNEEADPEKIGLIENATEKEKLQDSAKFNWGACLSPVVWSYTHECWGLLIISAAVRVICQLTGSAFLSLLALPILFLYVGNVANANAWENGTWTSIKEAESSRKGFQIKSIILFLLSEPLLIILMVLWY